MESLVLVKYFSHDLGGPVGEVHIGLQLGLLVVLHMPIRDTIGYVRETFLSIGPLGIWAYECVPLAYGH